MAAHWGNPLYDGNLYENINKNSKVQKNILYNQFVQNNNNKNKKKKIFISNKINRDFNLILTDRRKKIKLLYQIKNQIKEKRTQKIKTIVLFQIQLK